MREWKMKSLNRNHNQTALRFSVTRLSRIASLLCALALVSGAPALAATQNQDWLKRFVQTSNASTAAIKAFREGKEQIDDREWNKAASTFSEFIKAYANDKNVDAARYWLAFAYFKQTRYDSAKAELQQLIADFPKSDWVDDAKALIYQIAGIQGTPVRVEDLDKEKDEIKAIALQSLFQNDPERGAQFAAELLKPDSKASLRLKGNAISMLGQYRGKQAASVLMDVARRDPDIRLRKNALQWVGRTGDETVLASLKEMAVTSKEPEMARAAVSAIYQQAGPRATEILSEIARTGPTIEIRKEAIQYLGNRSGEPIVDELMKVYNADQDVQIRRAVVTMLSRRGNPSARVRLLEIARSNAPVEVRSDAVRILVSRADESNLDDLIKIYDADTDVKIRRAVIRGLADVKVVRAQEKLVQIARSSENLELRRAAIESVAARDRQQALDILLSLYDSEKSDEVKAEILSGIGQLAPKPVAGQPDQSPVARKLMEIARKDSSPKLRETALYVMVRRGGDQIVPNLVELYDAEKSEGMKDRIITMFCRSTNKAALRKLMDVAKSDASINLRKSAVTCLGRSKDPEAQKFIEDLLK
jgi:HEAT repeat protein